MNKPNPEAVRRAMTRADETIHEGNWKHWEHGYATAAKDRKALVQEIERLRETLRHIGAYNWTMEALHEFVASILAQKGKS